MNYLKFIKYIVVAKYASTTNSAESILRYTEVSPMRNSHGLVVEYPPATRKTRVQFPVVVTFFSRLTGFKLKIKSQFTAVFLINRSKYKPCPLDLLLPAA